MAKPLSSLNLSSPNALPQVMGILNVTPDSFSDGGQFYQAGKLIASKVYDHAAQMLEDGASLLDIGGESTRPGAAAVSLQEEMDRVLPILEIIQPLDAVISLDSSSPELMQSAAAFDLGLINDVRALQKPGALEQAAALNLPVCLMHMQGTPQTMQNAPHYTALLDNVISFLRERIKACIEAGIKPEHILLDPGFGFGKTLEHNLSLLKHLSSFDSLNCPVLVGLSRKSMIEHIHQQQGLSRDVSERMPSSIALNLLAVQQGAKIVRVHDVKETADSLRIWQAFAETA